MITLDMHADRIEFCQARGETPLANFPVEPEAMQLAAKVAAFLAPTHVRVRAAEAVDPLVSGLFVQGLYAWGVETVEFGYL